MLRFVKRNRRADAGWGHGAKERFVLSCEKLQCAYMLLGIIRQEEWHCRRWRDSYGSGDFGGWKGLGSSPKGEVVLGCGGGSGEVLFRLFLFSQKSRKQDHELSEWEEFKRKVDIGGQETNRNLPWQILGPSCNEPRDHEKETREFINCRVWEGPQIIWKHIDHSVLHCLPL